MNKFPEWRCTRPILYQDNLGRNDFSVRQGYYIRAETASKALAVMAERFPDDVDYGFDCELWKPGED